MRIYLWAIGLMCIGALLLITQSLQAEEAFLEVEVPNGFLAPIKLKDGRLLSLDRSNTLHSADGGRTWAVSGSFMPLLKSEDPEYSLATYRRPFNLCRLESGAIGLTGWVNGPSKSKKLHGMRTYKSFFTKSLDEGETWTAPVEIAPANTPAFPTFLIQTKSGRLIVPSEYAFKQNMEGAGDDTNKKMSMGTVFYSDDEGETWNESVDSIFVREKGGAVLSFAEAPCVAETADGRLLIFMRTNMQRLLQSYSKDDGIHWDLAELNSLLSSRSEMLLTRIPSTGDLLCVWNQADAGEIATGFYRSRLTSAISKDSGKTWEHFRTVVQSKGMKKVGRILPSGPPSYRASSGAVPHDPKLIPVEGFRSVRHPRVSVIDDKVYISFDDRLYGRANNKRGWENIYYKTTLRVMPLSWFYGEE